MKTVFALFAATAALLFAGCQTVDSRIKEKQAVFDGLESAAQTRIKQGVINVGDSSELVYIALGSPSEIKETTSTAGQDTTWVYVTRWDQYEGNQLIGHRRHVYYDTATKTYRVYFQPEYSNVYSERVEDKIRVFFKDGKVTAIEQLKS